MRAVFFLLCAAFAFAALETDLAPDSANPYGASEAVVNLALSAPLASYEKLLKKGPQNAESYSLSIDHRSWIGPAKQQSSTSAEIDVGCGSCVTFSAIAAAEIAYYQKFKKIANFSEMELVDCMYKAGGCNGNNLEYAVKHIFNNGITTRKDYPYKPTDLNTCNSRVTRYYKYRFVPYKINQNKESHWKSFITHYGGMTVRMYYGTLKMNKDGIVTDCQGSSSNRGKTNHAVYAVGYGKLHGVEYYLIRNSWGTTAQFHDNGYIKIKVGACNTQANPHYGFIFDSCPEINNKSTCVRNPTCKWSLGKCKSDFISFTTKIASNLNGVASAIDSIIDKTNGIGLNELPSNHVLRKNNLIGTEFMCFMKTAKKNNNVDNVISWFNKAVSNGSVSKNTGKIINYSKLRSLLGIKKAVTTTIATKRKLDEKYQKMDEYRFHLISGILSYWDARYNQKEHSDAFLILGTSTDGVKKMKKINWSN